MFAFIFGFALGYYAAHALAPHIEAMREFFSKW